MKLACLAVLVASVSSAAFAGAPVVASAASKAETAVLAGGCFWGMEEYFRKIPGVLETRVGYAGGQAQKAVNGKLTYEQSSSGQTGYAEAVEVKFDSKRITFARLLEKFFIMHDPTTPDQQINDVGPQYRSAIFTTGKDQVKIAEDLKKRAAAGWKKPVSTEISPLREFVAAEPEHQKYLVHHEGGYDNHFERKIPL